MRVSNLVLPLFAFLVGPASAQTAEAGPSAPFRSIELRGGGIVIVRHGADRQVTVRGASRDRPIRSDGDRLLVDRCSGGCPGGHRIEVEIVTPEVVRLTVADGGRIELRGDFPAQPAIAASVSSGGLIDMRPLEADRVAAAVEHGGRIFAHPGQALTASISNGGNVTYWGDPLVTSSIRHGGVVEKGEADDLRRPIARLEGTIAPPGPLVHVTPASSRRKGRQ